MSLSIAINDQKDSIVFWKSSEILHFHKIILMFPLLCLNLLHCSLHLFLQIKDVI